MNLLEQILALFKKAPAAAPVQPEPPKAPSLPPAPRPAPAPMASPEPTRQRLALARNRTIGARGVNLIKSFESCVLRAYPDPGSPLAKAMGYKAMQKYYIGKAEIPAGLAHLSGKPWTIGWGHTGPDVKEGMWIDQARADELLLADIASHSEPVHRLVKVPVTQNQYDAMVSFTFNCGGGNFAKSGLLRNVNAGALQAAGDNLLLWTKSNGEELPGLVKRRTAERALFLSNE